MSGPGIRVAAVDLGASNGRVVAGTVVDSPDGPTVRLTPSHRFANGPVEVAGSLRWDVPTLYAEVLEGLRRVVASGTVHGIGVDSWAVDYGLLDAHGELLGLPHSYRDPRTESLVNDIVDRIGARILYAQTGIQQMPINTLIQLVADQRAGALREASTMMLLPDLFGFWLTGEVGAERTNASTTQLYDPTAGRWADGLVEQVGLPRGLLPTLRDPGDRVGPLLPEVANQLGLSTSVPVLAVGSHDTASAVTAVPARSSGFAYISSGTWSLVGLELESPVLDPEARAANFSNETGIDGTIRFLKNVSGLWPLSESIRAWQQSGAFTGGMADLLSQAAGQPEGHCLFDINDPVLLAPHRTTDPMPGRIIGLARTAGEPVPESPAQIARSILDSLALAYRRYVHEAAALAGCDVDVIHVVGGGSQNALLCQLTADACERPVVAGPVEATAAGNVLVQARSLGADLPDRFAMRAAVRRSAVLTRYEPRPGRSWTRVPERLAATDTGAPR